MKKTENVIEANVGKEGEGAPQTVVALIRKASESGQLIAESEIFHKVSEQQVHSLTTDPAEEIGSLLKKMIEEGEDLHELTARDGSRSYYSSRFMTEAYAKILILKQGGSRHLIAEIVRQNSAFYPRPVPLDTFTQPPFNLTFQEVRDDLERMQAGEGYHDIALTTTSSTRLFLYSTLHLEPDHAAMLAEWLDVGQFENP